jgi:hypothetical protein
LLAQFSIERNVASKQDLDPCADVSEHGTGANDDASNDPEAFYDSISVKLEVRRDE